MANNDVGLYKFRRELLVELMKKGHEIVISLPYGEMVDDLINDGCEFADTLVDRRGLNPIKDIKLFFSYLKLIKKTNPGLVITYTIKPNVYGGIASRLLKKNYVLNITGLGTAFENEGALRKFVVSLYKIACKKAKNVFFENEENKNVFVDERIVIDSQACTLKGAGVNLEEYQLSEYPKGDKIRFLFIGRVMAEKGINELFEAMKRLIREGIVCELDVLGGYEEDYESAIEEYEKEGWLHYYGYQKDVRPFINRCHCFVLPSWHEGMANTNLECAASGRPLIVSNIPGCAEAIIDGISGFLVNKQDANDLYNKMKAFIELTFEERRLMGISGRKQMEKLFDRKNVVRKTINLIL